jgi:hypothetical protein
MRGTLCSYRRSIPSGVRGEQTQAMRRISVGEAVITATLLSIYVGTRGGALAIAAAQSLTSR